MLNGHLEPATELLGIARFKITRASSKTSSACRLDAWTSCGPGTPGRCSTTSTSTMISLNASSVDQYRRLKALIEHLAHIGGDLMQAISATGFDLRQTIGEPSATRAKLAGSEQPRLFTPLLSHSQP